MMQRKGALRSKWLWGLGGCALWLGGLRLLPLEEAVRHPLGPALFAVKVLLTFGALLPVLYGLGQLPWLVLHGLAKRWPLSPDPGDEPQERRWLNMLLPLLLGTASCGLATFALGLVTPPALWVVGALGGLGLALAWRYPPQLPPWSAVWPKPWWQRTLLLLVGLGYALRCGDALFFQGQEDAYLYHLSLAEVWLRHGQTGVQLNNIYSGYALTIEHYYLWLKLLVSGTAEQNALAQLTHLVVGYGTCLAALRALGGRWLGGIKTTALLAFGLHGSMIAAMILPKNDGYLAACGLSALYGVIAAPPLYFFAGALFAMAIKPTAGMVFIVIAAAAFTARRRFINTLLLLACGAALMLLAWVPFAWRNALVTGDPFFPLLAEVFKTPYAPGLQAVIIEARPLSLGVAALLHSVLNWLLSEPLALLALAVVVLAQTSQASRQAVHGFLRWRLLLPLTAFMLGGFVLLQEAMGPYATMVGTRHFLTMLGVLAVLSTSAVFAACVSPRQATAAAVLATGLGLGYASLDVSAREIFHHLSNGNLTQRIQEKKPTLSLYAELSRRLAGSPPVRVYAATGSNASTFLTVGDLWHATMTYPAWTWGPDLGGAQLADRLRQHQIDYLVTDADQPLNGGVPPGFTAMLSSGPVTLWRRAALAGGQP